jgi:hypothetical protein
LAAATLKEVRGEATKKFKSGREVRRPLPEYDLIPAPNNFHLL